ncbi:MAG: fumarylacetoacetate hydrolase family protein [Beutenbergiaceae bacterium]
MRVCNRDGRLCVVTADGLVDLEQATSGRFTSDPQAIWARWDEFADWHAATGWASPATLDLPEGLGSLSAPVPRPRQVFAIGLNYTDHVTESGAELPTSPTVFTKFASALTGPAGDIRLPGGSVDWEVEQVLVVGRGGRDIDAADAWSTIAGMTVGQDLSDRELQLRPPAPQFSLGKSHAKFAPIGPVVTSIDEFPDPDDVALTCHVNGDQVQSATTALLVFDVPAIVAALSAVCELLPGDLIFTGTPAGVGLGRKPPQYLNPGDVLETWMAGVGTMRHTLVAP